MDAAASEDYFFAVCHLEQFWPGLAIDELYDFATAFGAFAGFAIYDDGVHTCLLIANLLILGLTGTMSSLSSVPAVARQWPPLFWSTYLCFP